IVVPNKKLNKFLGERELRAVDPVYGDVPNTYKCWPIDSQLEQWEATLFFRTWTHPRLWVRFSQLKNVCV
ncbi:jg27976, partial [Pararge aegeria aegeria]